MQPNCSFVYSSRTVLIGYEHRRLNYLYNEHVHNLGVCQSKHIISNGPRILSALQVKGSSLWAAYFSLESRSHTTAVKVSKSCHNS